jgi:heme-degrading monooxygenase HmoA
MIFVSLTRLRVRSVWFMPGFFLYAIRSQNQVRRAAGFLTGALLPDRDRAFWTMTAWDSQESMRAYMISGAHKQAMPKLLHWCDEASVAHWMQEETTLPSWEDADERMRKDGRASKVLHPSAEHAGLQYKSPRTTGSAVIRPG